MIVESLPEKTEAFAKWVKQCHKNIIFVSQDKNYFCDFFLLISLKLQYLSN